MVGFGSQATTERAMPQYPGTLVDISDVSLDDLDLNTATNFALAEMRDAARALDPKARFPVTYAYVQQDGSLLYVIEAIGLDPRSFTYSPGGWHHFTEQELAWQAELEATEHLDDGPYDGDVPARGRTH